MRRTSRRHSRPPGGRTWGWLGAVVAVPLLGVAALAAAPPLGATPAAPVAPSPVTAASPVVAPVPRTVAAASSPRPSPSTPVVQRGDGRPVVVPGSGPVRGNGRLRRYIVAVEGGLRIDPVAFARAVELTLGDRRSWGADGRMSVQRVASGPVSFRVVLASPDTTDRLCRPLRTGGTYSCASGATAVVNARRWLRGADAYAGALPAYRQYVVNHEVGHTLGHGHEGCPGRGRLAPVMVQQTKGVGVCRPNPWPYPAA